ncbi:MAG: hypothetical protein NUV77_19220 [Thermoguttaceae bacterium]|jgi:hypothetical protein|nr:hypothetical protein [Thermoguttaceae bacterium]
MTTGKDDRPQVQERPDWRALAELGCWTTVALAPFLTWVNGPAVSKDQFVVRIVVFSAAVCGAVGLRIAAIVRRLRGRQPGG